MKFLKITLLSIVFLLKSQLIAQVDNKALFNEIKLNEEDTSKIVLSISNLNFLKNNEYFNKIATGYTFFGSSLNPKIAYIPNKYMRIEGGIFLRKDFGNPNFTIIAPTLSLKLQKNGYSFIFGNLEGALTHQLIEPLFNYERAISNPLENGLQFKINKKKVWLDSWIDWELQEYQNSNFQEHIGAGLSSKITVFEPNDVFKIQLPVQAFIFHHGGQIDIDTSALLSLGNVASGLNFCIDLSKHNGIISSILSNNYFVGYKDMSTSKKQPYKLGSGKYFNLTVQTKYNIGIMASYWQGEKYIARHGGLLYPSISSIYGSNFTEQNRKLIILRFLYLKEILPSLYLDVRFEPYKDLNNNISEFSYSVFISYKKDFWLNKKR